MPWRSLACNRSLRCCQREPTGRHEIVTAIPGGPVEADETAAEALVRELREEVNVSIDEPVSAPRAVIETAEFRMQIWLIDTWDGAVSNAAPDEHDEITWVDRSGISDLDLAHDD